MLTKILLVASCAAYAGPVSGLCGPVLHLGGLHMAAWPARGRRFQSRSTGESRRGAIHGHAISIPCSSPLPADIHAAVGPLARPDHAPVRALAVARGVCHRTSTGVGIGI